jgi:hypothetical protein
MVTLVFMTNSRILAESMFRAPLSFGGPPIFAFAS